MTPGVRTKKLGRSMSRLSSDGRWRGPDQKSPGHAWATDGRRTRTVGSYMSPHTRGRATHVRRSRTASSTSEHKTGEGHSSDARLAPRPLKSASHPLLRKGRGPRDLGPGRRGGTCPRRQSRPNLQPPIDDRRHYCVTRLSHIPGTNVAASLTRAQLLSPWI